MPKIIFELDLKMERKKAINNRVINNQYFILYVRLVKKHPDCPQASTSLETIKIIIKVMIIIEFKSGS